MAQPPLPLEALLAEAPFLRALAKSLVRGDAEAEDLEQETWLRALNSPPRHARSLRGWLATVALNLLRTRARRDERRTTAGGCAPARPPVPAPVEILAYQERLARVVEAVAGLPEPFRLIIHLRYHEECRLPEIAHRLGEPLDTIKSRLKRALQLLRERLDRGHAESRGAWCLALAPFLEVPKAVGPILLNPAVAGGTIMSMKVKGGLLVGGALLLALVVWWRVDSSDPIGPTSVENRAATLLQARPSAGGQGAPTLGVASPGHDSYRRTLLASREAPGPGPDLLVQVVDQTGAPRPGVPVAVLSDSTREMGPQPTDAQGITRFDGASLARYAGHPLEVAFAFVQGQRAPLLFDPGELPPEPLRLVLPPHGSVRIRLVDSEGAPVYEPLEVILAGFDPEQGGTQPAGPLDSAAATEGEALFPFVGLGLALEARLMGDRGFFANGTLWSGTPARGIGPERAGEVADMCLVLRKRTIPILLGRALGPGGKPLAGCDLEAHLTNEEAARSGLPGRTLPLRCDSLGRFRLPIDCQPGHPDGLHYLRLSAECPAPEGSDLLAGGLQLHLPLAKEEIPIGDIQLSSEPILVAGTVRDPEGRPVSDAEVRVETHLQVPDGLELVTLTGLFSAGERCWLPFAVTRTDAAGRFRIQGRYTSGSVGLSASAKGFLASPRGEVAVGTTDLALVLGSSGRLAGTVLLSPGVPPRILEARLFHSSAEVACQTRPGEDGRFEIGDVQPGTYRLELSLPGEFQALWAHPGLEIGPGQTRELEPIDLAGRIHRFEVSVEDELGAPLPNTRLALLVEGREASSQVRTSTKGTASLYSSRPNGLLEASAENRRTRLLELVPGPTRVVLRPGIPVELVLETCAELPSSPFRLGASLEWLDRGHSLAAPTRCAGGIVDEQGSVRLFLPGPGRYRIKWSRQERHPLMSVQSGLPGSSTPTLTVLDQDELQRFVVSLRQALAPDSR